MEKNRNHFKSYIYPSSWNFDHFDENEQHYKEDEVIYYNNY